MAFALSTSNAVKRGGLGIAHRNGRNRAHLAAALGALAERYGAAHIVRDPVMFAHRYRAPGDREIAAFLSATLAVGRVEQIHARVGFVLSRMGVSPAAALRDTPPAHWNKELRGLRPRYGWDVPLLMESLAGTLRDEGSLKALFLRGFSGDIRTASEKFVAALRARAGKRRAHLKGILPSPATGSACKRLMLFLRWMARPADGVDLGLWPEVPPSALVIPLDTHVARFARVMRLTRRKTQDWKAAEETTARLRALRPNDPVGYDFAIMQAGVDGAWKTRVSACTILFGKP